MSEEYLIIVGVNKDGSPVVSNLFSRMDKAKERLEMMERDPNISNASIFIRYEAE